MKTHTFGGKSAVPVDGVCNVAGVGRGRQRDVSKARSGFRLALAAVLILAASYQLGSGLEARHLAWAAEHPRGSGPVAGTSAGPLSNLAKADSATRARVVGGASHELGSSRRPVTPSWAGFEGYVAYGVDTGPLAVAVGDFNGDGIPDLASANLYGHDVSVLLGKGDGSFLPAVNYAVGGALYSVAAGDFSSDGYLDLAVANESDANVGVLLGNGNGTFQNVISYGTGAFCDFVAVGDLNGDGKLDIVAAFGGGISVLLGNGDGTFQPAVDYSVNGSPYALALGDVNSDGILDVVTANEYSNNLSVLVGNGDGTFQAAVPYAVDGPPASVALGDFNGDGYLDIGVGYNDGGNVSVLLNTSSGTFQSPTDYATGMYGSTVATGDFNGDGKLDLVAGGDLGSQAGQLDFFAGNGDGTLQVPVSYGLGAGPMKMAVADLNGDGAPDVVVASYGTNAVEVLLNTGFTPFVTLSPTSLSFGNQTVGTTSPPQNVTLTNTGSATLNISNVAVSGDFAQTNNCGSTVGIGGSCTIMVTFSPTQTGVRTGAVTITDNASNSPQTVPLTGTGVQAAVKLSPTSLTFPTQLVFTRSKAQTVTLTNSGAGTLTITSIAVTGEFRQTNNCGTSVAPGASCTIQVSFGPRNRGPLTGAVMVTDNAPGSPQTVSVVGTCTYIDLSPTSINFGSQPVGTTSLSRKVAVTNKGDSAVNISSISIMGNDPGDFAQTNNCGSGLASGASCFIKLTFTPSAKGKRTADVALTDNGGGSPQTVSLSGTGT